MPALYPRLGYKLSLYELADQPPPMTPLVTPDEDEPPPEVVAPPPADEVPPPEVVGPPPADEVPPPDAVEPPPTDEVPPPDAVEPPPTDEVPPADDVELPPAEGVVLPPADEVPDVGAAVVEGFGFGFARAFSPGTGTEARGAVTEARGEATETAGWSETLLWLPWEDDVDLVAAPIANAAANGITTATPSSSHRHRAADDPAVGAKVPPAPCTAAPLSICSLPPESSLHNQS